LLCSHRLRRPIGRARNADVCGCPRSKEIAKEGFGQQSASQESGQNVCKEVEEGRPKKERQEDFQKVCKEGREEDGQEEIKKLGS